MTVHREQNMKREDQQDATIRCLLLTSVSTCFGHHYDTTVVVVVVVDSGGCAE